jgi:hypothetical protein
VKDHDIDELLSAARVRSGDGPEEGPRPETLDRIAASLGSSLRSVRPVGPHWVLTVALVLGAGAVAAAGAARSGFFGVEKMTAFERVLVFTTLGLLACAAASESVLAMIPGSRRRISSGALAGFGSLALLAAFALAFRDSTVTHFVHAGLICLVFGLIHALPAALLAWLVLRRGLAIHPVSAGLAIGTLAGLAGVALLELHCSNFETAHVLVWHTAVVPIGAGLGALTAWLIRSRA